MSTSEKFNLEWNDFEGNISRGLRELRDDKDFFDVTLATDGDQISAHKVILAACSPFFRNILKRNTHQHPLLYMRGVRYTDLQSILDFMYNGEVQVAQEDLSTFLAVAEDLRVKGLSKGQGEGQDSNSSSPSSSKPQPELYKPKREESKRTVIPSSSSQVSQQMAVDDDTQEVVSVKTEPGQEAGAEGEELQQFDAGEGYEEGNESDGQCDDTHRYLKLSMDDTALLEQGGAGVVDDAAKDQVKNFEDLDQFFGPKQYGLYSCGICLTFTSRSSANLRMHIEAKHFPGTFVHHCSLCGEECKSKNALVGHTRRKHK